MLGIWRIRATKLMAGGIDVYAEELGSKEEPVPCARPGDGSICKEMPGRVAAAWIANSEARGQPTGTQRNWLFCDRYQATLLAFFRAAHLLFMPSLIRLRAAAERRLLPLPIFLPFLPCNAAMAVSNRLRSASNSAMILSVSTMVSSSSKDFNRCLASGRSSSVR
jgi:hypothetical protein